MLERLETIDWQKVRGAYGPIPDMPRQIRNLTSTHPSVANEALSWIGNNIIHQGTRWQSTPVTVPFLLELLREPSTPYRSEIFRLLVILAADCEVPPLPHGFDPDEEFASAKAVQIDPADEETIWAAEDWDKLDNRLFDILNVMPERDRYQTYLAVEQGGEIFAELTTHTDLELRRIALWSLGFFPNTAKQHATRTEFAILSENSEYMIANALFIHGLLAKYAGDQSAAVLLQKHMEPARPRIVRRAAATALVTLLGSSISTNVLDVLIEGSEDDDNLQRDTAGLAWPWNAPSLKGVYWRAIHSLGL